MTARHRAALAVTLLLAGCNLAPDPPPAETALTPFKQDRAWKTAAPADTTVAGDWWRMFGDAGLDRLEARLTADNQDLRQALARHDQALALAGIAQAAQYPQASYTAGASRSQVSRDAAVVTHPNLYNNLVADGSLSWELDLWGRVRNLVAGADRRAEASAADLAATRLALQAELASAFLSLQSLDAQQDLLDRTVEADQEALDFTRRRHDGGIAAQADVDQADLQLANARTQASDNILLRAQQEHAIALLVGAAPADFALPPQPLAASAPHLAVGLASALLERRPDIAAAERRVAASTADIGVSRAAFFPVFSLSGLGGVQSATPGTLANAASSLWSFGASASGPLFDGGQRSAANRQAWAARDEAVAVYRQTVLIACREVEDALVALHQLESEAASQTRAVAAARRALEQAQIRYQGGLAAYLEVITAQTAALAADSGAIDIRRRQMLATVTLSQALGGGWQGLDSETAAAPSDAAQPASQ